MFGAVILIVKYSSSSLGRSLRYVVWVETEDELVFALLFYFSDLLLFLFFNFFLKVFKCFARAINLRDEFLDVSLF